MLDRTETTGIREPSPAASRRIFRSKVDTIRPTYGFEDVSLAPGTETVEPSDVDLAQTFAGLELRVPILASAMDAVVDARFAGVLSGLGGLAVLNLEACRPATTTPTRCSSGSRPLPTTRCRGCSPTPTRRPSART